MHPSTIAFRKALDACTASRHEVAKALGVSKGRVGHWYNGPDLIGAEHCAAFCGFANARKRESSAVDVDPKDLRPDIEWQRDKAGHVTGYLVPVKSRAA